MKPRNLLSPPLNLHWDYKCVPASPAFFFLFSAVLGIDLMSLCLHIKHFTDHTSFQIFSKEHYVTLILSGYPQNFINSNPLSYLPPTS